MCSIAVACALIVSAPLGAHPRESQVMWTTDVEPIVRARCVGCHVEGGFAPMSLASYDEARKWGSAIATEVLERRMPPWSAAPGFAQYANDRSLSLSEVEMLVSWGTGGTPRGPDLPRGAARVEGASSPHVDLVLTAPLAAITSPRQRIALPTGLPKDEWLAGWAFSPGDASVVAHATIAVEPGGVLGTWTPPEGMTIYPKGIGMRLRAGARIILDLQYRRSARSRRDASTVSLVLGGSGGRQRRIESFACGTATLPHDTDVLAVTPRAAAARASLEVFASRPDGTIEPLTVVPSFHPQYPRMYRLLNPVRLPKRSQLHVRSSDPGCSADVEWAPATRAR